MRILLATVAVAAIAASTAAAAGHPSALPNCAGKPQVRPTSVVFSCADGNFGMKRLHWIGWGQSSAAATGIAYANNCTPNCAAGKFHNYQAVIVVSGAQRCGSVTAYKSITIAFVGPSPFPKEKAADLVYPAICH